MEQIRNKKVAEVKSMESVEEVTANQEAERAPTLPGSNLKHCKKCGRPMLAVPSVQGLDDDSLLRLRCFVRRGQSGCYIAECIDLDICAESETLKGAMVGLQDAMLGYLLVVFDGVEANEAASILRPSPLSHRIRYHFECLKYRVILWILGPPKRKAKEFYTKTAPELLRSHCLP
jgi:hypothetical protein